MAALPTAFQISADILSRTERADDIARLKSMMDLPTLGYVDVSAQMELMQALERWPLLAHLEAQRLALPADNPALTLQTHPETTRGSPSACGVFAVAWAPAQPSPHWRMHCTRWVSACWWWTCARKTPWACTSTWTWRRAMAGRAPHWTNNPGSNRPGR